MFMLNIALDGPAGAGKSTVAKALSAKLNVLYLDTGAMYRACALYAQKMGVAVKDEPAVTELLKTLPLSVRYENGKQVTLLGEEDVSEAIRRPEISMMASDISALVPVRQKLVEMQREIAQSMDCVLDGREIGTFVLPNCKNKFFITAAAEERAKRRYEELIARGYEADYNAVLSEIKQRDENDKNRTFAPLRQAEDAIVVDTTSLTIEQVIDTVISLIQK
ncbi:MAG: (d)CMP kinase [Clostridia bacterium]|nr:(d)CMP kinase [Clostridia bacterium]